MYAKLCHLLTIRRLGVKGSCPFYSDDVIYGGSSIGGTNIWYTGIFFPFQMIFLIVDIINVKERILSYQNLLDLEIGD